MTVKLKSLSTVHKTHEVIFSENSNSGSQFYVTCPGSMALNQGHFTNTAL